VLLIAQNQHQNQLLSDSFQKIKHL